MWKSVLSLDSDVSEAADLVSREQENALEEDEEIVDKVDKIIVFSDRTRKICYGMKTALT